MWKLITLVDLRYLWSHRSQIAAAVAGIGLGVTLTVAIGILNAGSVDAFRQTIDSVAGRAGLEVTVEGGRVPLGVTDDLRTVSGVRYAVPLVHNLAYVRGAAGIVPITVFGIDVVEEREVRHFELEGDGEDVVDDPILFLSQKDSILLTADFARQYGFAVDAKLPLTTAVGERTFTVRGLLRPAGPAKAYGGRLAVMDLYAAERVFGIGDFVDQIDLVLAEDADPDAVAAEVRERLGPSYRVETPGIRVAHVAVMIRGLQSFLSALAVVCLLVGAFLVYNTVELTFTQRRQQFGLLRCVGARRRTLAALLLGETAVLGAIGSALGIPFGIASARLLVGTLSHSLTTILFEPSVLAPGTPGPAALAAYFSLGVGTTVVAAVGPIRRSARVPPHVAARSAAEPATTEAVQGRRLAWVAGVVVACAALSIGLGVTGARFGAAVTIAAILALVLLVLPLTAAAIRVLRPACRRLFGLEADLACRSLLRSVQRSSVSIGALAVGIALAVMVGTLLLSMHASIDEWLEQTLSMDLLVSSTNSQPGLDQPLTEDVAQALATLEGVREVHLLRLVHLSYGGRRIALKAYAMPATSHARAPFQFRRGDPARALAAFFAGEGVFVSENFARHFGVGVGDTIALATPTGTARFPIAAIIVDFYSNDGVIVIGRPLYLRHWHDSLVDSMRLYLLPGADAHRVRDELNAKLGERFNLQVLTAREYQTEMITRVDHGFRVTYAIEVTVLAVALLGLVDCLLVAVAQRRRELGIFRALGVTRRQLRRMIVTEGGLLGVIGAVLGVVAGVLLGAVWATRLFPDVLGWVVQYRFPAGPVMAAVGGGLLAGTLAAMLPSVRASRQSIVTLVGAPER